jgi:hypothetical protein
MGVDGERHAPVALPLGMTRYPLYGRMGGTQGRPRRVRKISSTPGFERRTVQWEASCSIAKRQVYNFWKSSLCKFMYFFKHIPQNFVTQSETQRVRMVSLLRVVCQDVDWLGHMQIPVPFGKARRAKTF